MENQAIGYRNQRDAEEDVIDIAVLLTDFLKILKKLWWLFGGIVAACTVIYSMLIYLCYASVYRCEATFTVSTGDSESGSYSYYYSQNTADQMSKTFPYILSSNYFKEVLLENLGEKTLNGTLTADTISESNMVTMTVESPDASDALRILTAAIEIYPETARFVLGNVQFHMIKEPVQPTEPYNRLSAVNTVFYGAVIGLAVGIVVFGVLALFQRGVKTTEEMGRITSLKCMAAIPRVRFKARRHKKQTHLSVLDERIDFAYKESIRSLQIRLDRVLDKIGGKVILVTSTMPGEGKSTIAINLAETYAAQGKKVLLLDADLRKQADAEILGCGDGTGLQDIFMKEGKRLVARRLKKENIWFLGSTRPVKEPTKILSHPNFGRFIAGMKKMVDYVIIDTPPGGIFQDALLIHEYADEILYVVRHDFVPLSKIRESLAAFEESKERSMGYVFNAYTQGTSEYGYGRYGYGRYGYGKYGYGKYGKDKHDD